MKKKLIALFISMTSASAMAWHAGDFNSPFNISGTIHKANLSEKWEWRVGTGLSFNDSNWDEMTDEKRKLTLNVDRPEGILYGRTKQAIDTGGITVTSVIPNISFTDYEGQSVSLIQEDSDPLGKGHIKLPIKNTSGDSKIGMLKVNVTAVGLAVGPDKGGNGGPTHPHNLSMNANGQQYALHGGLFTRSISHGLREGNATMSRFQGTTLNELRDQVNAHPSYTMSGMWINGYTQGIDFTQANTPFHNGVAAVSYVLGIDQDQTLEATFNSPISSTTEWSAPLNVSVTYQ